MSVSLSSLLIAVAACGGSTATPPAVPPANTSAQPVSVPAAGPVLSFDEVSFYKDGELGAVLHADGRLEELKGKNGPHTIGTMFPDGRFVVEGRGEKQITITLDAEGHLHGPNGDVVPGVSVDADGTVHAQKSPDEAMTIHINDDGTLSGHEKMKAMQVKGVTAKSRRAVGFMLAAGFVLAKFKHDGPRHSSEPEPARPPG